MRKIRIKYPLMAAVLAMLSGSVASAQIHEFHEFHDFGRSVLRPIPMPYIPPPHFSPVIIFPPPPPLSGGGPRFLVVPQQPRLGTNDYNFGEPHLPTVPGLLSNGN
jgi:hypothetical protein